MSQLVVQSLTAFFFTLTAIVVLAPVAHKVKLLDVPDGRKQHWGSTPLIGGLAIFSSFLVGAAIWGASDSSYVVVKDKNALDIILACSGLLVALGALDDRFKLGVAVRTISEILIAVVVTELLDLRLVSLGDMFGLGEVRMTPPVSYVL